MWIDTKRCASLNDEHLGKDLYRETGWPNCGRDQAA